MYKQVQSPRMQTLMRRISTDHAFVVMLLSMTAAGFGLYWSARLAAADFLEQRGDTKSLMLAIALAPGNEDYLRRAAEVADEIGTDGSAYYRRALSVDPYAGQDWLRLGFDAERDGRYQQAEQDLLQAARLDRSFEPRWALANFYFRRGDPAKALRWIRQSLLIEEGDLTPAFRLCWEVANDPIRISRDALPNRHSVLEQYQAFLLNAKPGNK